MYCDKENVNILTALLVSYKIRHAVVCPGSRNAPLVHNFNECPDIICHKMTDERSAGFYAAGMVQVLHEPVVVCVTSGSALLNVLPSAVEAGYRHEGIIVISADRHGAWNGQLDGQTIPQTGSLDSFFALSVNLPEPKDDTERWYCNRLVNQALILASNGESVHINLPISEPLFNFSTAALPKERMIKVAPWSAAMEEIRLFVRPMIVLGQLPYGVVDRDIFLKLSRHFAVLAEPVSSDLDEPCFTEELIFSCERPDLVIYFGGNTVSKNLRKYIRSLNCQQMIVCRKENISDVSTSTSLVIDGDVRTVLEDLSALEETLYAGEFTKLKSKIDKVSSSFSPKYSGLYAIREFEKRTVSSDRVCYSNSLPLRYCQVYSKNYRYCNRGVNGIDGSLSTAAGASLMSGGLLFAVTGDLSFFYDENALWNEALSGNFRIVLINNGGGAIFKTIEGLENSPARDSLVSASHSVSAEGICSQYGVNYKKAVDSASLKVGLDWLFNRMSKYERPLLLEVFTDSEEDAEEYTRYIKYVKYELAENKGIQ